MVEVATEAPVTDGTFEIDAGGRDEHDIDGLGAGAAQPANHTVLEDREQLALKGGGQEADLVQKQGAAVRGLEEAGLGVARISERPSLVAEQLRLEQRLGNRGAVDVDKGAVMAGPRGIDRTYDATPAPGRPPPKQHRPGGAPRPRDGRGDPPPPPPHAA